MSDYREGLNRRYWQYLRTHYPDWQKYFERDEAADGRPPVFIRSEAWRNVLMAPDAGPEEIELLLSLIPVGERHRWYGSMNSSQALAHSVFGNLLVHGHINCLRDLRDAEGRNLFGNTDISADNFSMEHRVGYLGEPRPTSLDAFISGDHQIAIECKFTETEVGTCSRPRLSHRDSNYEKDFCDRTYSVQRGRKERCSLTEIGVKYWKYVPQLFTWPNDRDVDPCPLYMNYQLVRNVLAAGVRPDGTVSPDGGHALLVYDERNPAFQEDGNGTIAYDQVRNALQEPPMLGKCSWQDITRHLRERDILPWLTEGLGLKYGL